MSKRHRYYYIELKLKLDRRLRLRLVLLFLHKTFLNSRLSEPNDTLLSNRSRYRRLLSWADKKPSDCRALTGVIMSAHDFNHRHHHHHHRPDMTHLFNSRLMSWQRLVAADRNSYTHLLFILKYKYTRVM